MGENSGGRVNRPSAVVALAGCGHFANASLGLDQLTGPLLERGATLPEVVVSIVSALDAADGVPEAR